MPIGVYNHRKTKTPIYTKERNRKVGEARKRYLANGGVKPVGMLGKKHTEEFKKMMSDYCKETGMRPPVLTGRNHWNWKGGITPKNVGIRNSPEYKLWHKAVLERDRWMCVWCGSKEEIEADHIKPFAMYPELRFAIDNGRTLCRKCHDTRRAN